MEETKSLEEICSDIMDLEPRMRSARIINNRGHLDAGGMKAGIKSLEDERHDEMMFMELALRVRMRHEFDQELGPVDFSLSHRSKVIIMSFPLSDSAVLLASAELGVDFRQIPFQILGMIDGLRDTGTKA